MSHCIVTGENFHRFVGSLTAPLRSQTPTLGVCCAACSSITMIATSKYWTVQGDCEDDDPIVSTWKYHNSALNHITNLPKRGTSHHLIHLTRKIRWYIVLNSLVVSALNSNLMSPIIIFFLSYLIYSLCLLSPIHEFIIQWQHISPPVDVKGTRQMALVWRVEWVTTTN